MSSLHPLFQTITDAHWNESLARARAEGNAMVEEIRRRVRAEENNRRQKSSLKASADFLSAKTEPARGTDGANLSNRAPSVL